MNLVAFEFVASQKLHQCGVLVLSEFAGAARFLDGSINFNPANLSEMSETIYRAVTIPDEERRTEFSKLLKFVTEHTR
jgi:trehalose 6-phosphate synthase